MTTTALIQPSPPPSANKLCSDAPRNARHPTSEPPTFGEVLAGILPLIGVVVVAGPPLVAMAGFAVLLAVLVWPPFMLVTLVVVALVAATVLVALTGAILAMPNLLVRRLRRHRPRRAISGPAAQLVPVQLPRAAA